MTGFETYDASGKLTFSTRDSTYLVVRTKIIPGISNSSKDKSHSLSFYLPKEFTNAKATIYPTTTLHPSTGAIMPLLYFKTNNSNPKLWVSITVLQTANRVYPPCMLVILGN